LKYLLSPHFLSLLARERQTIADDLSHPAIVLLDRPKQIVILEKLHVSDNVILYYTLSRMVCHRFMALGSTYGVTSWNQSVSEIKAAIWCTFIRDISVVFISGF